MNLMRKIALICSLLLAVVLMKEQPQEAVQVAIPTLEAQPVEPSWEVARRYAQLMPPSSLEAPAPTVRLLTRPTSKQQFSRHTAGGSSVATLTHLHTRHLVGGLIGPMAATIVAPHRAFVRLCRWII